MLGGTVAGLAAGLAGHPVLEEGLFGAAGYELSYYAPLPRGRKTASCAWGDGGATSRAYQFWTVGLPVMINPSPLALDHVRKSSGVMGLPYACEGFADAFGRAANDRADLFVPTEGPRMLEALANRCQVRRSYPLAGIDLNRRILHFTNRQGIHYETLISTLPLDYVMKLSSLATGLKELEIGVPTSALSMQVLNVGIKLMEPYPVKETTQQILFDRKESLVDCIDIYNAVYSCFVPTCDDASRRVALAVKHIIGANEFPLSPFSYTKIALETIERAGFRGVVEASEYHEVKGFWPYRGDWIATANKILELGGVYQVGTLARGERYDVASDLMGGLAAGLALI